MAQCHTARPAKKAQCHLHLGSGTIHLQDAYCNESSMLECLLNSSKAAHQALRHIGSCSRPPSHYSAAPRPSLKAEMQQSWRSVCCSAATAPRYAICAQEFPQYSETDSSSSSSSDDEPELDPAVEAERLRRVAPMRFRYRSQIVSSLHCVSAQGINTNSRDCWL